jgi:hypothetical protein
MSGGGGAHRGADTRSERPVQGGLAAGGGAPRRAGRERDIGEEHPDTQARLLFLAAACARPSARTLEFTRRHSSAAVWEKAAQAALRTDQEPLFHHFLARHAPQAPLSLETRTRLETQNRFHAYRWEEIRECLELVLECLHEEKIPAILLKGISFIGDVYHLPRLRPMRDLDLLVEPQRVEAARAALLRAGFTPSTEPEHIYEGHHHLPPVFHPTTGVCVEVHHHPLNRRAQLPGVPRSEEFWTGLRPSPVAHTATATGSASVLSLELQYLVTCLHFSHSDHILWRPSHLVDIVRLLELHGGEINWESPLLRPSAPELALALVFPLLYLEEQGFSVPEEMTEALRARARLRGWERRLLFALINRYRIGLPSPWPRVSGRVANIIWEQILRRGNLLDRGAVSLRRILSRGAVPLSLVRKAEEQERDRRRGASPPQAEPAE